MAEHDIPPSFRLDGRLIVVTGASSAIGRATCSAAAELGAKCILLGRDRAKLEAVAAQVGPAAAVWPELDFLDDPAKGLEEVARHHGKLHGLVHCAGVMTPKPLKLVTQEDWRASMPVNVVAASLFAKAFRRESVNDRGGSIVLISSITGLVGQPAQSVYAASKGAIIAMTRSLAIELAPQNIRVNCVAPGLIAAGMGDRLRQSVAPDAWARMASAHPLGLGRPEDVGWSVCFLLSPASRWITGTTLVVDGGFTAQ